MYIAYQSLTRLFRDTKSISVPWSPYMYSSSQRHFSLSFCLPLIFLPPLSLSFLLLFSSLPTSSLLLPSVAALQPFVLNRSFVFQLLNTAPSSSQEMINTPFCSFQSTKIGQNLSFSPVYFMDSFVWLLMLLYLTTVC